MKEKAQELLNEVRQSLNGTTLGSRYRFPVITNLRLSIREGDQLPSALEREAILRVTFSGHIEF